MSLDTPSDAQNLKLQAEAHGFFAQYEMELENAVFLVIPVWDTFYPRH